MHSYTTHDFIHKGGLLLDGLELRTLFTLLVSDCVHAGSQPHLENLHGRHKLIELHEVVKEFLLA